MLILSYSNFPLIFCWMLPEFLDWGRTFEVYWVGPLMLLPSMMKITKTSPKSRYFQLFGFSTLKRAFHSTNVDCLETQGKVYAFKFQMFVSFKVYPKFRFLHRTKKTFTLVWCNIPTDRHTERSCSTISRCRSSSLSLSLDGVLSFRPYKSKSRH